MPDDEPEATDRQQLHLRIPPDLHAAISRFARDTERTLNGAGNYLIRRGLEAEGTESL